MSPQARRRVAEAVEQIGYSADPLARTLRNRGDLGLICLVVPDLLDPYFADVHMRLQRRMLKRGQTLIVGCHFERLELQAQLLAQMRAYRPAAVVLVPGPGTTCETLAETRDVPMVIVDRPVPGLTADTILAGNERGAEMLVERLIRSDDERVGVVSLPRTIWTQERRLKALERALRLRSMEPAVVIEEPAISASTGEAFHELFERQVTCVIALSVPPAMGVIRCEVDMGLKPLPIGGFDRHPWYDLVRPGIVTVSQSAAQLAERVDACLSRRRLEPGAVPETAVLPFRLRGARPQSGKRLPLLTDSSHYQEGKGSP